MTITTGTAPEQTLQDATKSKPTTADTRIHWADAQTTPPASHKSEPPMAEPAAKQESAPSRQQTLEQKFEAMRARNWITDRMVAQYQKHWHCSREAALERLLSKTGA